MAECSPSVWWQRFARLASSDAKVLKHIVDILKDDSRSLRAVNDAMRTAINRAVTIARCTLDSPCPSRDLAEAFPEADQLICDFEGDAEGPAPPVEHASLFLDDLSIGSPTFVAKLRVLNLKIRTEHIQKLSGIMAEFLPRCASVVHSPAERRAHGPALKPWWRIAHTMGWSSPLVAVLVAHTADVLVFCRCTSLQGLGVRTLCGHTFVFEGKGCTPAEQCSSMQQQITAMRGSSEFLAPSTWPACSCTTVVDIDCAAAPFDEGLGETIVDSALRCPSLVDLAVAIGAPYPAEGIARLQQLSCLTNLTLLRLDVSQRSTDEQQLLCTAVGKMSSLRRLKITGKDGPAQGVRLPLAQLCHLTCLDITSAGSTEQRLPVNLGALAGAPALQHLFVAGCTGVGPLSSLFALTSLTYLGGPVMGPPAADGDAAATAPAAWTQRLQGLSWHCTAEGSWPPVVQQLTSLTRLYLRDACVSPDLCRWVLCAAAPTEQDPLARTHPVPHR
jgi:hypothetical protein